MAFAHSLAHHFATEAYNNAWANHRLLRACGRLSQADFAAPRTGFFPSIKATLNHILTVDRFYVDALERSLAGREPHAEPGGFFRPEEPFERCAELAAEQRATDRRLLALCEALRDEDLGSEVAIRRPHGIARDPVRRILAHLFQHQVHHRGQAHAMLSGTPVAPPQLDDFYCVGDAPRRAEDFAELGFSEAAIWREG
jgi:uncharacterized damage-inducible protein DinB